MSAQDFANLIGDPLMDGSGDTSNQSSTTPNATPYTPAGNPDTLSSAYRPLGLPRDPDSQVPPEGLESTTASESEAPQISTAQSIWSTIKSDSSGALAWGESAAMTAAHAGKSAVKAVYANTKEIVTTVASDVSAPLGNVLKTSFLYILLGLVVVGGVVYFAGKSGAVSVRV